jgi:hypothetical protein
MRPLTTKLLQEYAALYDEFLKRHAAMWPDSTVSTRQKFETFCNLEIRNCSEARQEQFWQYVTNR